MKHKIISAILFFTLTQVTYAGFESQQELNKRYAIAFCDALMNQKDFTAARQYIGDRYVQHDPKVADGIDGLKLAFDYLRMVHPKLHIEIKRVVADGDYVYLHIHSIPVPNTNGYAVVDIFRFENGKIVEHWDAMQEVPWIAMNRNGMF